MISLTFDDGTDTSTTGQWQFTTRHGLLPDITPKGLKTTPYIPTSLWAPPDT